jgi:hypothetical protein
MPGQLIEQEIYTIFSYKTNPKIRGRVPASAGVIKLKPWVECVETNACQWHHKHGCLTIGFIAE